MIHFSQIFITYKNLLINLKIGKNSYGSTILKKIVQNQWISSIFDHVNKKYPVIKKK